MSRENVEFVEGLYAGAAGADKQALLTALPEIIATTCDPDIEWIEDPQRADSRVHRGHAGVRESRVQPRADSPAGRWGTRVRDDPPG